jgi:hypothetical protein
MRNLLLAVCCLSTMMFATTSFAGLCTLTNCASTLAGDAGHTIKKCTNTNVLHDGCNCLKSSINGVCNTVLVSSTSSCPTQYSFYHNHLDGRKCCTTTTDCAPVPTEEVAPTEEIQGSDENIASAFDNNLGGSRANTYYGYVDGSSRSPSGGRTSDPMAKLDACLFHTDVTAIDDTVGTADDKHHACVGASIGCGTTLKNEYCQASGTNDGATVAAAVCKDRCDCIYTGAEGSVCGGN